MKSSNDYVITDYESRRTYEIAHNTFEMMSMNVFKNSPRDMWYMVLNLASSNDRNEVILAHELIKNYYNANK